MYNSDTNLWKSEIIGSFSKQYLDVRDAVTVIWW